MIIWKCRCFYFSYRISLYRISCNAVYCH